MEGLRIGQLHGWSIFGYPRASQGAQQLTVFAIIAIKVLTNMTICTRLNTIAIGNAKLPTDDREMQS